jgi:adenosylmethionine-8-amino-7-oxononanoate aminotransferase
MCPRTMVGVSRDLAATAQRHLWLHFTTMDNYRNGEVPIIVRGDGCYLEDTRGKRYLDALAGLLSVNIGYGFGTEIGEAAARQMRELPYYTNWEYAHPRAIELAAKLASLAPDGLNRVFFVSGGSEAVEAAWKLAREYHHRRGDPRRHKAIARESAYHGTTMGALSLTGLDAFKAPFLPLVPDVVHVSNTNRYHRPQAETETEFTEFLLDELEQAIRDAGPETIAMIILEPVQNAGGSLIPPAGYFTGVRDICDRHGILMCADEVICGFGRLGAWFGSERYQIRPDLITCAKGLSSSHACIGALIVSDVVAEPFLAEGAMFTHGMTFGGHPVQCAIALKNIEIMEREDLVTGVRQHEDAFRQALEPLLELPIVGDLRGAGYFLALELVKDKNARTPLSQQECDSLLQEFVSPQLLQRGLICRCVDRGDPVIQLSPPLIARQRDFDQIAAILGDVLADAGERLAATPEAG